MTIHVDMKDGTTRAYDGVTMIQVTMGMYATLHIHYYGPSSAYHTAEIPFKDVKSFYYGDR